MKIARLLLGVFLLCLTVVVVNYFKLDDNDFKIGVISNEGISLRNISLQRKMVNYLEVGGEVPVWIPRGLGWYQANKINKLLVQEKKEDLADQIFFYNFGFIPDVVVTGESKDWLYDMRIIKKWGWLSYVRYRFNSSGLLDNTNTIKGDLIEATETLGEVIQRDFADNRLLREDLRITVYNNSQISGVASVIARNLEWAGMTVVGVENYSEQITGCKITYGENADNSIGLKYLRNTFSECVVENDVKLGKMEVELYVGEEYARMLNYESYKTN